MKTSKWAKHLDFIRENRERLAADELAAAIGTTRNNLHKICMRHGISLTRKKYKTQKSIKGMEFFRVSNHDGYTKEAATAFLNSIGYRVIPDPFMRAKSESA